MPGLISLKEYSFLTPVVLRHHLMPVCLGEVFNEFIWEDFTERYTRKGKIRVELQLSRLFAAGLSTAPHKVLLRYFLVKHARFFPI